MKTLRLFVLLPFLFAACGDSSSEKSPQDSTNLPTDTAAVTSEAAPALPDSAWVAKGIPDPAQRWNSEDMQKAFETIQKEHTGGTATLPHYDSTDTDGVFARIISPDNLAFFRNDSLSLDERINMGTELVKSYAQIYFLYASAAMSGKPYSSELTELMIGLLRLEGEFGHIMQDFLKTVPEKRRDTETFKNGMQQVRGGIAQSFGGVITVLRDKDIFTQAQLEKLARSFGQMAPDMLTYLEAEQKEQLVQEAQRTLQETENPVIRKALTDVFQINPETAQQ